MKKTKKILFNIAFSSAMFCIFSMVAVAHHKESDIIEHANDILRFQWWIIGLLGGCAFGSLLYIYFQHATSLKEVRQELEEQRKVLMELVGEHKATIEYCKRRNIE
jgi:hypothetical protein